MKYGYVTQTNQTWICHVKKKLLFPEMCNFSSYPLALHS